MIARFLPILLLLLFASCAGRPPQAELRRFEFETPQMGVPFRIVLYAPGQPEAEGAAQAAFARVSELNAIMSDYEYDSELSQLGRTSGTGRAVKVSDDLWKVLRSAQELARASNGSLDVTVGPAIQLWRKARREKVLPPAAAIEGARRKMGYTNLVLANHTAELKVPGMRLDLGAIAKGYAADEALRCLRARGLSRALVAASGDMALGDPPPGEKGWKIELSEAGRDGATPFLLAHNCGVATSGDLFQFVEIDGRRYSHILDPRTGVGLTNRSLATVVARDGINADRLSTAISVLGPDEGMKLARRFGAEARATSLLENGAKVEAATPGFWKRVVWIK